MTRVHSNAVSNSSVIVLILRAYTAGFGIHYRSPVHVPSWYKEVHPWSAAQSQSAAPWPLLHPLTIMMVPLVKIHDVAAKKREEREAKLSVYREWRVSVPNDAIDLLHYPLSKLTETERTIVRCDATGIVELIRKRVYTAEGVLQAFVKVAVAAQDVTNCLTEVFFEEAFVRARELDQYLETTGNVIGPLHGLPVSIKDHIKIKGLDTSSGYLGE